MPQKTKSMDKIVNPERLVSVPFSKTRCGVDFYINSGYSSDVCGVLTENQVFKTDFFSFYFFRKANGYLLLNCMPIWYCSSRRISSRNGTWMKQN